MRKYIVSLLIIALITMAQQCQTNNEGNTLENPFFGDPLGLQIGFEPDAPPDEVSDGGNWPFDISVKLLNLGEHYVEGKDVKVTIHGPNAADFGLDQSSLIKDGIGEDIYPVAKDPDTGEKREPQEVFVTFDNFRFQDTLTENFQFDIKAEVCYKYGTRAVANGCVVSDPTQSADQAYCLVKEEKEIYNSGAPIQITKFEEMPHGTDKIKYVFTIKKTATSGRFFLPGTKCPTERGSEHKLHFKIDSRVTDLDCRGVSGGGKAGEVYLGRDGEAQVTCIQQVRSSTDFIDRIAVTLEYDYLDSYTQSLLVKATGGSY